MHQVAVSEQLSGHVLWIHLLSGLANVSEQASERARAAYAMPLVAQTPGRERERVARFAGFGQPLMANLTLCGACMRHMARSSSLPI